MHVWRVVLRPSHSGVSLLCPTESHGGHICVARNTCKHCVWLQHRASATYDDSALPTVLCPGSLSLESKRARPRHGSGARPALHVLPPAF
eukprot:1822483-Alexandrium_andersonii.AAC.1